MEARDFTWWSEFQVYLNDRSLSYVTNGHLYLHPRFTTQVLGTGIDSITQPGFEIDLNGCCTNRAFNGSYKQTTRDNGTGKLYIVNPVASARVSTVDSFAFKYGRVEIRAQLPKGDWLWPALWMLPKIDTYGGWPCSGEMYVQIISRDLSNSSVCLL